MNNGSSVLLKTPDEKYQEYIIDTLIADNGSSCLCYRAHRKGMEPRSFILKEFYPKNKGVTRDTNGELILTSEAEDDRIRFMDAVEVMKNLSLENEYRHNIVGDVTVLSGNGTVFCRNEDYTGSRTWDTIEDKDFLQVLTCMKAIARILDHMHGKPYGYVYMDLKPANILLRGSVNGVIYDEPVFIDFDSVLTEGVHKLREVHTTEYYRPKDIIPSFLPENSKDKPVNITSVIDKYAFGMMLEEKITPFRSVLNVAAQRACDHLCSDLKRTRDNNILFSDIESRLDSIIVLYNKPRLDMCRNSYEINKRKYDLLYKMILPITFTLCIGLSFIYMFLADKTGTGFSRVLQEKIIFVVFSFAALLSLTLILQGLKLLLTYFAIQLNNAAIASRELQHGTCGSDISLFILGDRELSKFREGEDARIHHRRQKRRRILWIVLGVLLAGALGVSVHFNAFPLFLIVGSGVLILFMYADCIPSNNEFYRRACGKFDNTAKDTFTVRDARAGYFEDEYDMTDGTFDLNSEYYKKYGINLYTMKKDLADSGGIFKESFNYDAKRRIYSMAIDRERNVQVISGIAIVLLNFFVLLLDLMLFFDLNSEYFMISRKAYPAITFAAVIVNLAVNVIQIMLIKRQEAVIAQMAFNSKFLENRELEKRLGKDIINGLIKPIDIARGIYQHDAYCYSQKVRPSLKYKDKLHLHYVEIADRGRMGITIWLIFCMVFSWFVWIKHMHGLFPYLLAGTIVIHIVSDRFLLPLFSRMTMRWRIKKHKALRENEGY